ncbi:MAG: class I SAM-dependent methyltransferase [Burkholderiaceae bacterium]|nr:MAG: class I SAM-dependent methyltransferase [Burkholderiaceae bacterium]
MTKHHFTSFTLDPIAPCHWRNSEPIPGTKLGFCETCGFSHVDPYPSAEFLSAYYSKYEMPTSQANLAETARFLSGNIAKGATVLDMGCGDGAFLKEMHALGFTDLIGFDQSPGLERAKQLGFGCFYNASVWDFLDEAEAKGGTDVNAVVMVNVLEHVPQPLELLTRLQRVLPADGVLCITVPNDFSPLQNAFLKAKGHAPWFVCLPDHVNYFTFSSLGTALGKTGFEVADQSALYPMELFLLQDLDYIADPSLGPIAHRRRVMFEDNMKTAGMADVLDHFYRTLAAGGYGRDIMLIAKKSQGQA